MAATTRLRKQAVIATAFRLGTGPKASSRGGRESSLPPMRFLVNRCYPLLSVPVNRAHLPRVSLLTVEIVKDKEIFLFFKG